MLSLCCLGSMNYTSIAKPIQHKQRLLKAGTVYKIGTIERKEIASHEIENYSHYVYGNRAAMQQSHLGTINESQNQHMKHMINHFLITKHGEDNWKNPSGGEYWRDISVYILQLGLIQKQKCLEGQSVTNKIGKQSVRAHRRQANSCLLPWWQSTIAEASSLKPTVYWRVEICSGSCLEATGQVLECLWATEYNVPLVIKSKILYLLIMESELGFSEVEHLKRLLHGWTKVAVAVKCSFERLRIIHLREDRPSTFLLKCNQQQRLKCFQLSSLTNTSNKLVS